MIEAIVTGLVCLLLGIGGGFIWGVNVQPKEQIVNIDSKTYVTTEQNTRTEAYQSQITIVDTKTNINLNLTGLTNLIKTFNTNTNYKLVLTNK